MYLFLSDHVLVFHIYCFFRSEVSDRTYHLVELPFRLFPVSRLCPTALSEEPRVLDFRSLRRLETYCPTVSPPLFVVRTDFSKDGNIK